MLTMHRSEVTTEVWVDITSVKAISQHQVNVTRLQFSLRRAPVTDYRLIIIIIII